MQNPSAFRTPPVTLSPCHLVTLLPCQPPVPRCLLARIRLQVHRLARQAELLGSAENLGLRALDLDVGLAIEGVECDLHLRQPPDLAPLGILQRHTKAHYFENGLHRLGRIDAGLPLGTHFQGRPRLPRTLERQEALSISQNSQAKRAVPTQKRDPGPREEQVSLLARPPCHP